MTVRVLLMVDALRDRDVRALHRVVLAEVLPDDLVALGEERDVYLHKLVVLRYHLIRLFYQFVAFEPVVPLLAHSYVRHAGESHFGWNIWKIGLVAHA